MNERLTNGFNEAGMNIMIPQLEQEQVKILETPIDELKEDELFIQIPLAARLINGVSNVKQLAQRQRETSNKKAANQNGSKRPPEARINNISNSGRLKI